MKKTDKKVDHKERSPISAEAMKLRLAGLCARSEQCEYDLRQKIFKAGLSGSESDEIIGFLRTNRYLDEERYAAAYTRDKVRFAGWGRRKIRQGLSAKRVSSAAIDRAIDSIDSKEYIAALKRAGIAKARSINISSPEDRAKFYRHLASRGFEMELIHKLADAIIAKLGNK
ncbi:MAG: RecX family transcriptional regulator [Muribaculaceae bacterium]|nr:RecX family transcriptional regulator [Muribaculaceae bacterium]